jgi:hypothetical protein
MDVLHGPSPIFIRDDGGLGSGFGSAIRVLATDLSAESAGKIQAICRPSVAWGQTSAMQA